MLHHLRIARSRIWLTGNYQLLVFVQFQVVFSVEKIAHFLHYVALPVLFGRELVESGSQIDIPGEMLVDFLKEYVDIVEIEFGEEFNGESGEFVKDLSVIGGIPVMKHDFLLEEIFVFEIIDEGSVLIK